MTNAIITNGECAAILADNKRLRQQLAEAQAAATMWKTGADNMARECERLKQEYAGLESQRDAIEEALLNVQLQGVEVRAELEAARKVADAAVIENLTSSAHAQFTELPEPDCDDENAERILLDAFYQAQRLVDAEVREYRALAEPCPLGHENPNMRDKNAVLLKDAALLSPGKRAVIDAAIERVGDIETMREIN
jgi:hypothetical protein